MISFIALKVISMELLLQGQLAISYIVYQEFLNRSFIPYMYVIMYVRCCEIKMIFFPIMSKAMNSREFLFPPYPQLG